MPCGFAKSGAGKGAGDMFQGYDSPIPPPGGVVVGGRAANMKAACRSDMFLKTRPGIPLRLANVDTLRVPAVVNGINDAMGAYGVWASGVGKRQMRAL
eukprot:4961176-Lingulodinium_polyedra.AAC.1